MKDLNAVFQPEKVSHSHGLQISYTQGERMRNLFVYHEDGQVGASAAAGKESIRIRAVVLFFNMVSVFIQHSTAEFLCLTCR